MQWPTVRLSESLERRRVPYVRGVTAYAQPIYMGGGIELWLRAPLCKHLNMRLLLANDVYMIRCFLSHWNQWITCKCEWRLAKISAFDTIIMPRLHFDVRDSLICRAKLVGYMLNQKLQQCRKDLEGFCQSWCQWWLKIIIRITIKAPVAWQLFPSVPTSSGFVSNSLQHQGRKKVLGSTGLPVSSGLPIKPSVVYLT